MMRRNILKAAGFSLYIRMLSLNFRSHVFRGFEVLIGA
jgi:hypothetical protein